MCVLLTDHLYGLLDTLWYDYQVTPGGEKTSCFVTQDPSKDYHHFSTTENQNGYQNSGITKFQKSICSRCEKVNIWLIQFCIRGTLKWRIQLEFSNSWSLITHNCSNVLMCEESFVPFASAALCHRSHNYILKEKERETFLYLVVGERGRKGEKTHRKPDQKPIDLNHISQSGELLPLCCSATQSSEKTVSKKLSKLHQEKRYQIFSP